jgi:hypothetical protein
VPQTVSLVRACCARAPARSLAPSVRSVSKDGSIRILGQGGRTGSLGLRQGRYGGDFSLTPVKGKPDLGLYFISGAIIRHWGHKRNGNGSTCS